MRISLSTGSLFTLPLHKVCELSAQAGMAHLDGIRRQQGLSEGQAVPAGSIPAGDHHDPFHSCPVHAAGRLGWSGRFTGDLHRTGRRALYPAGQFSPALLDGVRGRFLALAL